MRKLLWAFTFIAACALAQVPPDIAAKLKEWGPAVCPADTAQLYRPLQPTAPYPGVKVERDISVGPDPRNKIDVFSPEKGGGKRPVLIYVAGGAGNKIEPVPGGEAFYDNIMLWAVKNGMTGVNLERKGGGGEWDQPAKDIGMAIQWVHDNIAKYKGNPDRVFIWAHSAGNPPVGTYIGHPELYGKNGIGIKGAILMGPAPFSLYPVAVPQAARGAGGAPQGTGCPTPTAGFGGGGGRGAAKGGPGGGGAAKGGPGGARGRGPQLDEATQQARSNLNGILKSKIAFFLGYGEIDIGGAAGFINTLNEQLTKAGNPATVVVFKDHSHMSEVFSPNTKDTTVTAPILKWMKSVK